MSDLLNYVETTTFCEVCGEEADDEVQGVSLCEDCISDDTYECKWCHERHFREEEDEDAVDHDLCTDCWEDSFICEDCGHLYNERNEERYTTAAGYDVCEHCRERRYMWCERCDELYPIRDVLSAPNGEALCNECFDEVVYICDRCECSVMRYDVEDGMCPDCVEEVEREDEDRSLVIHNYGYKPFPLFKGRDSALNPFLGVELEVECPDGYRRAAAEDFMDYLETRHSIASGFLYLKEDGSLRNGFEIVSHPGTLAYHRDLGWDAILKKLKAMDCKSHDAGTCGIHVHMAKKHLTMLDKIKLSLLVHGQPELFTMLSKRKYSQYAQFINKEKKQREDELKSFSRNYERYEALNFRPSNTVEFRMFKGSLVYTTFMARLELVAFCNSFIKSSYVSLSQLADEQRQGEVEHAFISYLKKSKHSYPILFKYTKQRLVETENERLYKKLTYSPKKRKSKAKAARKELEDKAELYIANQRTYQDFMVQPMVEEPLVYREYVKMRRRIAWRNLQKQSIGPAPRRIYLDPSGFRLRHLLSDRIYSMQTSYHPRDFGSILIPPYNGQAVGYEHDGTVIRANLSWVFHNGSPYSVCVGTNMNEYMLRNRLVMMDLRCYGSTIYNERPSF